MKTMFDALGSLERVLDHHLERQNVVHSNIANINTPGYRAKDVSFDDSAKATLSMEATQSGHLSAPTTGAQTGTVSEDTTAGNGIDGNNVSLEREMAKLMANSTRYEAAADIVGRRLAMLRYAASDGTA